MVFLFFNIAVHYSNCVQLRDAGITNTGQHILLEKNTSFTNYCDQDYMGGGRLDFLGEIPYFIPGKLILTYFATSQCILNVKTNLDHCIKDHGPDARSVVNANDCLSMETCSFQW